MGVTTGISHAHGKSAEFDAGVDAELRETRRTISHKDASHGHKRLWPNL